MTSSKSGPLQGEIALTLTVLSFAIMLLGTILGGVQKTQTTSSKAAGDCTYYAQARIKGKDIHGEPVTLATGGLGTALGVRNNETHGFLPFKDEYPFVYARYDTKTFTLAPYVNHQMASVTLEGLDETKYRIIDVYYSNLDGGLGGWNASTSHSNDKKTIKNIEMVPCGIKFSYGWEIEPINTTQSEPTPTSRATIPTPTASQVTKSCFFNPTAYVKLQLDDKTEIPLDVKVEQNVTAWKFTNNAQVVSTFTSAGTRSFMSKDLKDEKYCCGTQNDKSGYDAKLSYLVGHSPLINAGTTAKVTLSNYVPLPGKLATYTIVKKYGMTGSVQSLGLPERVDDLKIACSNPPFTYSYGWVLKCTGQDCYRPLIPTLTPTPVQGVFATMPPSRGITTIPTATTAPICTNNKGTIKGHVYVSYGTGNKAQPFSTKQNGTRILIRVCNKKAGQEVQDTCTGPTELAEQMIYLERPDTEYSIPNMPSNKELVVILQKWDNLGAGETITSETINCTTPNRLGAANAQEGQLGKGCIVQLKAPSCTTGPNFDVAVTTKSPTVLPTGGQSSSCTYSPIFSVVHDKKKITPFADFKDGKWGFIDNRTLEVFGNVPNYWYQAEWLKMASSKPGELNYGAVHWHCANQPKNECIITKENPWGPKEKPYDPKKTGGDSMDVYLNYDSSKFEIVQQCLLKADGGNGSRLVYCNVVKDKSNANVFKNVPVYCGGAPEVQFYLSDKSRMSPLAYKDLNGDFEINVIDIALVIKQIGTRGPGVKADINKDGVVNAADVAHIIVSLGTKLN